MSSCLMIGALALNLASAEFELSWRHSVEKTVWRERWAIQDSKLVLQEAAVKGSGAGMDPGEGATLRGEWWVWRPEPMVLESLVLAASGATGEGWRICGKDVCHEIGNEAGAPIVISSCAD